MSDRSAASIVLVAPVWLQDAMEVLLDGTTGVVLIASATDVDSLIMLDMVSAPDFVLLDANRDNLAAVSEVQRVMEAWPRTECVVLVEDSSQIQILKSAGASFSLLKGASPQRLREVLEALAENKMVSEHSSRLLLKNV